MKKTNLDTYHTVIGLVRDSEGRFSTEVFANKVKELITRKVRPVLPMRDEEYRRWAEILTEMGLEDNWNITSSRNVEKRWRVG